MRIPLVLFALSVLAGCSASTKITFGTGGSGSSGSGSGSGGGSTGSGSTGSSGSGSGGSTSGGGGGSEGAGGSVFFDAGPIGDGGPTEVAQVFGNTPTTLYSINPLTDVFTEIGDFTGGCDTVIDIAINKSGQMYATTFTGFYQVDPTTAVCTYIADGTYPNSLSFVPAGTLDPNVEALVGYNFDNNYVRIDLTTGAITNYAALTGGYASSGDIVSVIGGGTYLTVTGPANTNPALDCSTYNCIIQVDPKTGGVLSLIGPIGYTEAYGLAYWGGAAYGFDAEGDVFQIDLTNGTSTLLPNTPAGLVWYGAGSTTSAPLSGAQ